MKGAVVDRFGGREVLRLVEKMVLDLVSVRCA
jgi:hypothetical protein